MSNCGAFFFLAGVALTPIPRRIRGLDGDLQNRVRVLVPVFWPLVDDRFHSLEVDFLLNI